MSICTMTLETVCKIYPRCWHLNGNSYSARRIYLSKLFHFKLFKIYSNMLKCVNLIEIRFYAYRYASSFLVLWHIIFETTVQIPEVEFGGQIRILEGKYPTLTFGYYWTCKNEHIATKYVIKVNFHCWMQVFFVTKIIS